MSEQKVKRAHKVLSTSKQTACVGAGNQDMFNVSLQASGGQLPRT